MSGWRRKAWEWLRINLITALSCMAGALLGSLMQLGTTSLPQNWPQMGIGLVAAWIFGPRCFIGLWLVYYFTVDLETFRPAPWLGGGITLLVVSGILTGQVILGSQLLGVPRDQNPLDSRWGVVRLFLLSGLLAGLAGNTIRLLSGLAFQLSYLDLVTRFTYRLSKYVSGAMLMAPLAFMIYFERLPRLGRREWAVFAYILLSLIFVTSLASTDYFPFFQTYQQMLILLVLPLTLWATLVAGTWGATLSVFVASLFPIWGTLRGWSAFGAPATTTAEILIHLYLVTVAITTLTVGAVLKEQRNAAKELREAKSDLEAKVRIRTEDLRRERDFGSAIFDTIGALVVVATVGGAIIRLNRTFQEFIGKSAEEVEGASIWDLGIHPQEEEDRVKARFTSSEHGENHLIRADGVWRLFQWTNTRLDPRDEGEPQYIVAIGIDVTERRRAQEEALEAIQARDLFLSVASHELRTPLTTLQLQLQSLQRYLARKGDFPEEIPSRLVAALRQTRRLGDLINELLDVSRITYGRLVPERSETDLSTIVREVIERYRFTLEQKGSELTVRGLDEHVVGFWDPLRIDQIVDNLVSNAIKYGQGRPIEVAIDREGDDARIVVRDHGIGISAEDQERIFGRFERAVSIRYYGGFGLGLWIARQMVEAHDGEIRVESELGEGSTFTVVLPLCSPNADPGPA